MQSSVVQIGNFSYYPSKVVGQGATGSVYLGFRNQDMMPVAVKAIKLRSIDTQVKKHLLDCEVSALRAVKNHYICQAYDVLKDGEFYFVPQEYCPNGTLRDYIKRKVKLPESEALKMFAKIVEGYCAIRKAGYIHRDLKSENILLRSNFDPAIIDFGYCEKTETQGRIQSYNVGSPAYMSPEAYNDSLYSEKSDVWALGIVLHEMLTGTIPLMRTTNVDEYFKYLKNMKTAEIMKGQQNPLCIKILLNSLTVDTRLRFSSQELLELLNREMEIGNSPIKQPVQIMQRKMSYPYQTSGFDFGSNYDLGSPVRKMSEDNWNLSLNKTQSIKTNSQRSHATISNSSNKNISTDSPTFDHRQTPINPTFGNIRKRIQANENNFNFDLKPIRNFNTGEVVNQNPQYWKEPQTPMLSFAKIPSNGIISPPKIRKAHSSNNLTLEMRHH